MRSENRARLLVLAASVTLVLTGAPGRAARAGDEGRMPVSVRAGLEGASIYSYRSKYTRELREVYLGFDAKRIPIVCVARGTFEAYGAEIGFQMIIRKQGESYVVSTLDLNDLESRVRESSSRRKIQAALSGIAGRTMRDDRGRWQRLQADREADRDQKRILKHFDRTADQMVSLLLTWPGWPTAPLPKARR